MRGSKTVNGVKHEYYYVGSQLRYEKYGTTELYFNYDSAGNLSAIYLYQNNILTDVFFTVTNIQGDVVSIYSSGGTLLANYEYDDWGNVIAIKSADGALITNTNHISYINPIRYRGYYFDTETGLYYLQSRYYNPQIGRFLNADSQLNQQDGPLGFNMFAYCLNNPVVQKDSSGHNSTTWGSTRDESGGHNILQLLYGLYVFAKDLAPVIVKSAVSAIASTAIYKKATEKSYTVYSLNDSNGTPQYVGRTKNEINRKAAHERNPDRCDLEFTVIEPNLTYAEARGLEQIKMIEYHTLNTANKMNNQINGIYPSNPNLDIYMEAALKYLENKVTNEVLNMFE